jgi:hypothetical protein
MPDQRPVRGLGLAVPPTLLNSPVSWSVRCFAPAWPARWPAGRARQAEPREPDPDSTRLNSPRVRPRDAALALLLDPPRRGFIAPAAAVRDAFDDLRAHEVAVLAGMRGALAAVLDRFNPATLELRLAEKGLWDNLLPVNRKARLWERYIDQHAELAREIEDNFDAIFAGAFIEAYEAQLARLTRTA